jgi:hypothetical protein
MLRENARWNVNKTKMFSEKLNQTPENVQDREISEKKNQTPVRGQDGKISDIRERFLLVSNSTEPRWRPEIFPLGV